MKRLIRKSSTPEQLPATLWHGTKWAEFIAKDDLIMNCSNGKAAAIRFTTDPKKLTEYDFPFWFQISTSGLNPKDFEHMDMEEWLWNEEDEYCYLGQTFDLKPYLTAIYVRTDQEKYFTNPKRKDYYPNLLKLFQENTVNFVFQNVQ